MREAGFDNSGGTAPRRQAEAGDTLNGPSGHANPFPVSVRALRAGSDCRVPTLFVLESRLVELSLDLRRARLLQTRNRSSAPEGRTCPRHGLSSPILG